MNTGARDQWRTPAGLRRGLRRRTMTYFALGAVVVTMVMAVATYLIARSYLVGQRENSALHQAYADAGLVRDGLLTTGSRPGEVIGDLSPPAGSRVLVHASGRWYSSELEGRPGDLPPALQLTVRGGSPGVTWVKIRADETIIVGIPLPAVGARFYEISSVEELHRTLAVLRAVLTGVGVVTAAAAALLGRSAAGRAVRPLDEVAAAAAAIAAGRIDTRLSPTDDPDLAAIVGSFNTMVDALANRIERERRFTADVSHELRSPLTALVTGVELLEARRGDLPERSGRALDIVSRELSRFQKTLEDLLQLARLDVGPIGGPDVTRSETDLLELVRHVLDDRGERAALVRSADGSIVVRPVVVRLDRRQFERALVNLVDNADRHGGGLTGVTVGARGASAYLCLDDRGPGVPPGDRERIFARFARGPAGRRDVPGTGLGLSIVAETVQQCGGAVWCTDRPDGPGARFVVRLPAVCG